MKDFIIVARKYSSIIHKVFICNTSSIHPKISSILKKMDISLTNLLHVSRDGLFFLRSISPIFPTICEEIYESKTTNVFYTIFSFKWDPWWHIFGLSVAQVFISRRASIHTSSCKYSYLRYQVFWKVFISSIKIKYSNSLWH